MIIKVSSSTRVEIVVPKGMNLERVKNTLRKRSGWVVGRLREARDMEIVFKPETISLTAIKEDWQVKYQDAPAGQPPVAEGPGHRLSVNKDVEDLAAVTGALNAWLCQRASVVLSDWLQNLSRELSLPYRRLSIRRQKTRWGSCSSSGAISLNQNLMFLHGDFVRYVLIHELCHLVHMDHSGYFWALIETYVPDFKKTKSLVRNASYMVPTWAKRY